MVKKFMYFDEMLTPKIIQLVFWVLSVLVILAGLIAIIGSFSYGGGLALLTGLLTMILGPIGIRIWCELMIVIFKIHESLQVIRERN